jgi:hypothetical protein
MNLRNQQRAHTMNVFLSLRTNAVLNEHRINFYRGIPFGTRLTKDDLPKLKEERKKPDCYNITSSNRAVPTLESVSYIANLYEFICVGMRQGDLDETIIRMSLRGIFVTYHDAIRAYIDDVRTERPKVFEHFVHYVEQFRQS